MGYVVTHDGKFHADEMMALAILQEARIKYDRVIYTRNPETIAYADWAIDVGGVYDPDKLRFDHHQKDPTLIRETSKAPYASAGLLWKHCGRDILRLHNFSDCNIEEAFTNIDDTLMVPIDSVDNGHNRSSQSAINMIISGCNRPWDASSDEIDKSRVEAQVICKIVLFNQINRLRAQFKTRYVVRRQASLRDLQHILVLEKGVPWIEEVSNNFPEIYICIYPITGRNAPWYAQVRPAISGENVFKFPELWAGLFGDELIKACGVDTAIFCHKKSYICGAATKEGAIQMAQAALNYYM